MKLAVSSKQLAVWRRKFLVFCSLPFACCLLGCGVPNLEAPECTEARQAVKAFYSYHFGNEMRFSAENLKQREKFLTPEFAESLRKLQTDADVFTTGDTDYPKAFSAGECRVAASDKTVFDVLLFWKTDTRTEQRKIKVEAVKQNDKWLIDKVIR